MISSLSIIMLNPLSVSVIFNFVFFIQKNKKKNHIYTLYALKYVIQTLLNNQNKKKVKIWLTHRGQILVKM